MNMQIVSTIKAQIIQGGMMKVMSWGANSWAAVDEYTLRFKVQGHLFKGFVQVFLTPMDVYRVTLIKRDGTVVKTFEDVYNEDLTDIIDNAVERIPAYKI